MEPNTKPLTYEEVIVLIKNKEIDDDTVKAAVLASHRASLLNTKTEEISNLIKETRNILYTSMWIDKVLYSL